MSYVDLHIHSQHSPDADLKVSEIFALAVKNGVSALSITDHNTVKAHKEICNNNLKTPLNVIPGIELDCTYSGKTFHMLGYFIDYMSSDFENWEKEFINRELNAVPERIRNLQKLGMKISEQEVFSRSGGKTIPQEELMAEIILEDEANRKLKILEPYFEGGKKSDQPLINFFWDFFGSGKPAHVSVEYLNIYDAVEMIRDNGGTPILAHPGANFKDNIEIIDKVLSCGLAGMEVFSTYHSPALTGLFREYAESKNIMMTCGSDFHGKNKPSITIGGVDSAGFEDSILRRLFKNKTQRFT